MGVRGPQPAQQIGLEGKLIQPGLSGPVSPTFVSCSFWSAYAPDRLWRSFDVMPPLPPEPCDSLSSSPPPMRSGQSCPPVPRLPAGAACAPTCVSARIRAPALCELPGRPLRCCPTIRRCLSALGQVSEAGSVPAGAWTEPFRLMGCTEFLPSAPSTQEGSVLEDPICGGSCRPRRRSHQVYAAAVF